METNFSKSHEEMQLERINTVAEPKGWWHKEVEELKQQLADHIKREVMLRDGLKRANDLLRISYDYFSPLIREAIAATADLDGLIVCHAEPVAWQTFDGEGGYDYRSYEDNEDYRDDYIKRNSSQKFYENWVIPLYRAWEPKL